MTLFANAQNYEITFVGLQDDNVVTADPPADGYSIAAGENYVFSIALGSCQESIALVSVDSEELTSNEGKYTIENVQENKTVTVTFNKYSYLVTATLLEGAHGSVAEGSASQNIECGSDCTVTFVPDENYQLDQILVDGEVATEGVNGNSITLTNVRAEHSVSATFEEIPATPTYEMTFSGLQDDNVVTVYPAADNYIVEQGADFVFSIALGDCQEAIASVMIGEVALTAEDGKYTVADVQNDTTITVTFTKYSYTVTATLLEGAHGSVAEGSASQNIECGSDCTVTFVPDENYQLNQILVDGEVATEGVNGNSITLTNVRAEHSVSATFEEIPAVTYTITFTIGEHGTVTYNGEAVTTSVTVNENAEPAFTITPESGYRVASAIIDEDEVGEEDVTDAIEDNVYTFEAVTANHTMHITFEENTTPNTHTVTLTVGEHGTIVATDGDDNPVTIEAGVITVNHGDDLSLEITPENGYKIDELVVNENPYVLDDDELLGLDLPLLNITSDMTVSVTFEEDNDTPEPTMFGITFVGLEEGNTVTVPENARVDSVRSGDDYVFGITLTSCQQAIASVTVGGTELTATEGQYTIENVVSDTTVTVEFTKYFYTVTAEAGEHGAVAEGFASHDVECGTDYTITFVPEEGYILDSVVVDNAHVTAGVNGNNFTLTNVVAAHEVKGFFAVDQNIGSMFAVTFEGLGNSDTIVVPVNADSSYVHTSAVVDSVLYGDDFVFAINPERCQYVESVSVNGTTLEANGEGLYTINVTSDTTITVELLTYVYTITASAGEHGRLNSDAEAEVNCGTSHTLEFVPEAGYKLGSVLVDGEATTDGISGNNYTLVVDADHTIVGEFVEFRGPYIEYEGLVAEYEVGDTIDFSLRMHANCMFENICGVGYAVIKGVDTVADVTRYGVLSYKVNVTDDSFVGYQIENGKGMMTYTTEYDTITYNVGAFTLGLFDEAAGRNRTIDYNMIFTTAGQYRIANTLYTCSNGGELIGSNFVASECDDLTHNDRVAEVCANPTPVYSIYSDINITGETIHTITTTILGGHGSVNPEGTIIVPAGSTQRIQFIPDEYYALDTVKSNGFLIYPSLQTQYVVDSVFVIDSVTENYNITVSFKDVRPYYTIHVEVATAGGTVTPKDTTVVIGSDVTLTITPNEGYQISQLSIDGNIISNYASNEIIFRDVNEDHEVSISFFPSSVEDEVFAGLSIYPNPNNGQFTISSEDFEGDVTFQIYSVSGSMLYEKTTNGEQTVNFDNNLSAGTYFLRIISGDKVAARKIVVE